jgi:lipopolysaccharide transport system ATP-binding protein
MSADEVAIRVRALSKSYQVYDRPEDRLKQSLLPRVRRLLGLQAKAYSREFWALRDIDLSVMTGQAVGIVGRNGSGKSTLLQTICGTLAPTTGDVYTNGRIAALLELGAGFNPEFTGRENVYLNASLIGLSKQDVDARFADIERFADIGEFIDQPIKTYSSGMYVRLAFAVVAHVDADIQVIDEALAVGDAAFTQKCMRYIRNFKAKGTLLLVSHDIPSVMNLCDQALWLDKGTVRQFGNSKQVCEEYLRFSLQETYGDSVALTPLAPDSDELSRSSAAAETPLDSAEHAAPKGEATALTVTSIVENAEHAAGWRTGVAHIESVRLEIVSAVTGAPLAGGERVKIRIIGVARQDIDDPIIGFLFRDRLGQDLFGQNTLRVTENTPTPLAAGDRCEATFAFTLPLLPNGQYAVMAAFSQGDHIDHVHHHWMHDSLIVTVQSPERRYGLVGIPFDEVTFAPIPT